MADVNESLLTASEVAAILGVVPRTVLRLAERDELPIAQRIGTRGDRLFRRADVVAYLERKATEAQEIADRAAEAREIADRAAC